MQEIFVRFARILSLRIFLTPHQSLKYGAHGNNNMCLGKAKSQKLVIANQFISIKLPNNLCEYSTENIVRRNYVHLLTRTDTIYFQIIQIFKIDRQLTLRH